MLSAFLFIPDVRYFCICAPNKKNQGAQIAREKNSRFIASGLLIEKTRLKVVNSDTPG